MYRYFCLPENVGLEALFPYSSIDDEHEAFVYLERNYTGRGAVVMGGAIKWSHATNRLLLFINKKTGIVDEVAYHEEFTTDRLTMNTRAGTRPASFCKSFKSRTR
jgi:hypothetical protein